MEAVGYLGDAHRRGAKQERGFHQEHLVDVVDDSTPRDLTDDARKFVPQLRKENIEANQSILDLLAEYAAKKQATKALISLSWMLRKYPNVVPIPGSRNQERILENLGGWNAILTDDEFQRLDDALNRLPVHGYRGFEEYEGCTMADWGKRKLG